MKIQLEELDLLARWPDFMLRGGYRAVRVLVRIGIAPIGLVTLRPVRKRLVSHRKLRRRIAALHAEAILKHLAHAGLLAGPEALQSFLPHAWPATEISRGDVQSARRFVHQHILHPAGLASPLREWVIRAQHLPLPSAPAVTVALCTSDRADRLEAAIQRLRELDYPNFDILIVDNSADPVPTREIVEKLGVHYIRCAARGISRARNAALACAGAQWVALIDDDCEPVAHWLTELMRVARDANCRAVAGLVLPAHLDTANDIAADLREADEYRFTPRLLDRKNVTQNSWPASAGAALLLHAPFARSIGGFDPDLGAGPQSIASGEDIELLDRILREGGNVQYNPAAIVYHHRSMSAKGLRKHIGRRAAGRAALHVNRALVYGDRHALLQLLFHVPRQLLREFRSGLNGATRYPFSLSLLELQATFSGSWRYGWTKLSRALRAKRFATRQPAIIPATMPSTRRPQAPGKRRIAA